MSGLIEGLGRTALSLPFFPEFFNCHSRLWIGMNDCMTVCADDRQIPQYSCLRRFAKRKLLLVMHLQSPKAAAVQ